MIVREAHTADDVRAFHGLLPERQSLFTSPDWCANYAQDKLKRFMIEDNGKPVAGFVAYKGGTAWLPTLVTPPFAQHCGLFWDQGGSTMYERQSRAKEVGEALAVFLSESSYAMYKIDFPYTFLDMQPFLWAGIDVEVRYTYRLLLAGIAESGDMPEIAQKTRNRISKGIREGLVFSKENGEEQRELFERGISQLYPEMDEQIVQRMLHFLTNGNHCAGVYSNGKLISAFALPACNGEQYLLLNALNKDVNNGYANAFGLAMAIQNAKREGHTVFDFEGSMIPAVEKNFRRFGGVLTPMFSIRGGKFLLPALYKKWKG
jgi:hypothetical protein